MTGSNPFVPNTTEDKAGDFPVLLREDLLLLRLSEHDQASDTELYVRALKLMESLRFEEAIEIFSRALITRGVPVYLALLGRGRCWQQLDRHMRCVDDLSEALKSVDWAKFEANKLILKRKCRIHVLRAASEAAIKRTDLALKDYDDAQRIDSTETSVFSGRASLYMLMQQFESALQNCQIALKLDPKNYLAFQHLGMIYAQMNRLPEAIKAFDNALEIQAHYETFILRGKAFSSNGEMQKALEDFSSAVTLKPTLPLAYGNRAALYAQLGNLNQAIADATEWIDRSPKKDALSAYHARGVWQMELGEHADAIADFTQVLKLDSKHMIARCARATAFVNIKEYDKAITDWLKIIQSHQQFARGFWSIGEAYALKKEFALAIKFYSEALRIEQKNKNVFCLRAKAYSELCMRQHAIADLTYAIRIDPKDPRLYLDRAFESIQIGQFDKALADLNTAISINPYIPEIYERRAAVFIKLRTPQYGKTDLLQAKRLRRKLSRSNNQTSDVFKFPVVKKSDN